ncbi:MAG: hypothetical protein BWY83_03111 [bacterium ADurb.Bin478]|nr:MAG: hypothetical protein BWY83_03111 [bacterium ADurb.Bin478]
MVGVLPCSDTACCHKMPSRSRVTSALAFSKGDLTITRATSPG